MNSQFHKQFNEYIHDQYPTTAKQNLTIFENLITPEVIDQPKELLEQARRVAKVCYKLRDSQEFQRSIFKDEVDDIFKFDPKNYSLFMSYDFHIRNGKLKLIEINTNAAFSLVAHELHQFQKTLSSQNYLADLKTAFENESLLSIGQKAPAHISIADDNLPSQKMFIEFVMFGDLFSRWGWDHSISEMNDLKIKNDQLCAGEKPTSLVYNRSTNFSLNGLSEIRKAYVDRKVCLSPNPHEYFLMAEKTRMIELADENFLRSCGLNDDDVQILKDHVPFSKEVKKLSSEEAWALRKKVFFKPKRSYAGKEVYKGESITKKVFDHILQGDFIAQELIPAPTHKTKISDGTEQEFKYDLRFYAYRDQVHLCTARLYQGQVTNFRAPGSGFAPVRFQ